MNCKPGDLAIVVKSSAGNEGKILTCIRLATFAEARQVRMFLDRGPIWFIDKALQGTLGPEDVNPFIHDYQLRPIRPNDGEDEMIRIAGKPHDTHKSTTQVA